MAAYNFLIRRMLTLPLDTEQQHNEWQQILHIAHSNNIPKNMLTRLKLRIKWSISQAVLSSSTPTAPSNRASWVTFTYSSPQIRKITNIFKHTDIKIPFKCDNTISQLSMHTNRKPPHYTI